MSTIPVIRTLRPEDERRPTREMAMFDKAFVLKRCALEVQLVFYMNQAYAAPCDQPGPWGNIQDGYCAGLAVRWHRLAYAGRNFPTRPGAWGGVPMEIFDGSDWQATVYQNMLLSHTAKGGTTRESRARYVLGLAQMKMDSTLFQLKTGRPRGVDLANILLRSYGCYYVSLGGPGYGHAIAFRHARPSKGGTTGEFHIFDANIGHLVFATPGSYWAETIDWYFKLTGYDEEYTTESLIGRVTPPINHDKV